MSRQPELLRNMGEMGLSLENCERWFERAVMAFVACMVIVLVVRVIIAFSASRYKRLIVLFSFTSFWLCRTITTIFPGAVSFRRIHATHLGRNRCNAFSFSLVQIHIPHLHRLCMHPCRSTSSHLSSDSRLWKHGSKRQTPTTVDTSLLRRSLAGYVYPSSLAKVLLRRLRTPKERHSFCFLLGSVQALLSSFHKKGIAFPPSKGIDFLWL